MDIQAKVTRGVQAILELKADSGALTLALGGLATALALYYVLRKKEDKYPPGPFVFPLVGNLPQLAWSGSIEAFIERYRKQYGNVFTFEIGGAKKVVVAGYESIQDLLIKNADYTSTRMPDAILSKKSQEIARNTPGLIWAPYPHWKTLRSFAINTLREDGMGKSFLEPRVMEEIDLYLEHFVNPNLGRPIDMAKGLSQATCNIISQMMYNKRFDYDDESFNRMISAIDELFVLSFKIVLVGNLPLGKYFISSMISREEHIAKKIVLPTLQSYIDEHKTSLDTEHPRDLTDRYLIRSGQEKGETSCYSEENGALLGAQLYIAGAETTATALRWALLFMCIHPEFKERVQKEIDEQIGSDRHATCKDRVNMPYTDAVLLEVLRVGNVAPNGLPHTLEKKMIVGKKVVPAGADLMIDLTSVLNDETVFEEPEKFKPERYLSGDIALKKQRTIPFGIGRRACLGESLAKMEFFLFFVTFLQKYDLRLPETSTVSTKGVPGGLIHAPAHYNIIFSVRHPN